MNFMLGKAISTLYRHQTMVINQLIEDLNISSGHYLFLIYIHQNPDISQKELSQLLNIDIANTNRALRHLKNQDYITIYSDEKDKRIKRSKTTPIGQETTELLSKRLKTVTEILSRDMSEEEVQFIGWLLEKMDGNIMTYLQEKRLDDKKS